MPRLSPRALPLAAALMLVRLAAAEPGPTLLRATDLLQLQQPGAPALSPDGRQVAYVVKSIEPKAGATDDWAYQNHLWLAALDGATAPRRLTRSAAQNLEPAWSPDGDRLAFVRAGEKEKPQVFVLALAGGEATALTKLETGATGPRWSPDGKRLLFTSTLTYAQVRAALEKDGAAARPAWNTERPGRAAGDTANWPLAVGDKPKLKEPPAKADPDGSLAERREWLARDEAEGNPRVLDQLRFQSESDIESELHFTHVFVQDATEGAEARDVTPGFVSYSAPAWSADGRTILCAGPEDPAGNPSRGERFALYQADAAGGGVKPFANPKDTSLGEPTPSPDGRWVACVATPGAAFGYGQSAVAILPAGGGELKVLTASVDRPSGSLRWAPDSAQIYFVATADGGFPLYRVDPAGTKIEKLTEKADTGVRAYDVGRAGVVEVLTTPDNPGELYAASAAGRDLRRLSQHNGWIAGRRLAAYEAHRLVTKDGLTVPFWTMKPTAFDPARKYPLLVEIHGGPQAMWGPGEDSMWFEFQYFAARGFVLVFANPRGSGGYGYTYQHANHQDWGTGPAGDILSAVDFAAKEPYVDRRREVVTGGSYGGYMTAWIIGHDHRFKAAVAQRGVYDLGTFFGEGNAWRLVPVVFDGYPWETATRRLLERESPLTYVADITTPLLIQHGDNDRRTGFVQSEMLLRSLKVLGRPVESVRYPRATHELSRSGEPKQRLDTLVRYEEFFRRYIGED